MKLFFNAGPCTNLCARHFLCAMGNVFIEDYHRCFKNGEQKIFASAKNPQFIWRKFGPKYGWPMFHQN